MRKASEVRKGQVIPMAILRFKKEKDSTSTEICPVNVEVSESGVMVIVPDEVCFIPKNHIAGIVFLKKTQRLEIYSTNGEVTNTISGLRDSEEIFHKILGILRRNW